MKRFSRLLPIAAVLVSAPVEVRAQIVPGAPTPDWERQRHEYTADVLRAYDRLITEWRIAWDNGDVAAASDLYLDDAILFVGDTVPMQGRANIAKLLGRLIPVTIELRTGLSDFVASERLAYALGPFYWEVQESGTAASRIITGTIVTILVRDGRRWRIRSQILRSQSGGDMR